MGDEEPQCKVEYLDVPEGAEPEETNWIKRAGKCRVTYPNGHVFEGRRISFRPLRALQNIIFQIPILTISTIRRNF